jgi:putative FmdB family regulatory protein
VPTYQYTCTECGEPVEAVQKFSDAPLTVCAVCGGRLRKVFSPVGIVFKGSGFYRTDSRKGSAAMDVAAKDKSSADASAKTPASESSANGSSSNGSSSNGSGSNGAGSNGHGSAAKKSESASAPAKSSSSAEKVA